MVLGFTIIFDIETTYRSKRRQDEADGPPPQMIFWHRRQRNTTETIDNDNACYCDVRTISKHAIFERNIPI